MKVTSQKASILYFLFLHSFFAYSQLNSIDSLQKVLQTQNEDTNKVNILNEISYQLNRKADYLNSKEYVKQALSLSEKIKFRKGIAFANKNMGFLYSGSNGNFTEALKYLNAALMYFNETGDKKNIGDCYLRIGSAYFYLQTDVPEALKNALSALKIFEETGDKQSLATCYRFLSAVYQSQGNSDESIKNSLAALKYFREIRDTIGVAYTYNLIGSTYYREGKLSEALEEYQHAMENYKHLGNRGPAFGIPWTYGNIGDVYEYQAELAYSAGNKTAAENKFLEALEIFELRLKIEEEGNMSHRETYQQLGNCYVNFSMLSSSGEKAKKLAQARKYYEKALQLAVEAGNKELLASAYYYLASLDTIQGNYKLAYKHYKLFTLYNDSLFNEENTKKSTQLKMQHEFDKKDAIEKAEQQKIDTEARLTRNLQYNVIIAFFLLAIFLFWNNRQKQIAKTKIEKAYTELKSTQSQLIQSEKMASLGELTAGIAHEIQNPLNFVNNFSDLNKELIEELQAELKNGDVREATSIAENLKENEDKINIHGRRADGIIKSMLQHSRASSGQKEATDVNNLVDEFVRLAYHGYRGRKKDFNVTLDIRLDPEAWQVKMVAQDIGRVLLNLLNNAFQAVDEKTRTASDGYQPTVAVSTKRSSRGVDIRVEDNGPGIPDEIKDKVFQPFFTTRPTGQGTGLGLSLSYDIVKAHGGELRVETKESEGSTFIIQLPTV